MKVGTKPSTDGSKAIPAKITGDRILRFTAGLLNALVALMEEFEQAQGLELLCYAFPDWFLGNMQDADADEERLERDLDVLPDAFAESDSTRVIRGLVEAADARRLLNAVAEILEEPESHEGRPSSRSIAAAHTLASQLVDSEGKTGGGGRTHMVISRWLADALEELAAAEAMDLLNELLSAADPLPGANTLCALRLALSEQDRDGLLKDLTRQLYIGRPSRSQHGPAREALMCLLCTKEGVDGQLTEIEELV